MSRDALSVSAAARERGEAPALVTPGGALSWSELAREAARRNAAAPAQGGVVRPVLGDTSRDAAIALFAAIEAAVPALLLHPAWTAAETSRARALVEGDAAGTPRGTAGAAPLAIVFTSGSLGEPSGVLLSRRAFLASARASAARLGWQPDDRWLLTLPTAHVGGLSILTRCLVARATVVALPRFEPEAVRDATERERVTLLSLVPTMLARLLDLRPAWRPPPRLRAVLLGGAAAPAALLEEARARGLPVLATYGLTEACSQVATQQPGTPPGTEQGCGTPLPGIEVTLDPGGQIRVAGPTLLSGRLGGSGPVVDADGRLATGDLGRFDAAGRLHVTGRIADTIVSGGENVSPAEVEGVLAACAGVREALVFGVADAEWGELVAALLTPADANGPDLETIGRTVRERLAAFKRPRRVAVVDALPLNRAGKPDRAAAARRFASSLRPL